MDNNYSSFNATPSPTGFSFGAPTKGTWKDKITEFIRYVHVDIFKEDKVIESIVGGFLVLLLLVLLGVGVTKIGKGGTTPTPSISPTSAPTPSPEEDDEIPTEKPFPTTKKVTGASVFPTAKKPTITLSPEPTSEPTKAPTQKPEDTKKPDPSITFTPAPQATSVVPSVGITIVAP